MFGNFFLSISSAGKFLLFFLFLQLIFCNSCKTRQEAPFNRTETGLFPQWVQLPESLKSKVFFIVQDTTSGLNYPAQKWDASMLVFLKEDTFSIPEASLKISGSDQPYIEGGINIINQDTTGVVTVSQNKKPVLHYQLKEKLPPGKKAYYKRGGFIHPVYSPSGKVLTDDFPAGHSHQHGVFFAFVNTTYKGDQVDFWNQQNETGTVEPDHFLFSEEGPVFGRLRTRHKHVSLKYGTLLTEDWTLTVFNTDPFRIEIETSLQSVGTDTLFIKPYHYGGMAIRGSRVWNKEDSLHFQNEPNFLTSKGDTRVAANHSRPTWSAMAGLIDGQKAGIALIGNKNNYRYPEPVRIHPEMPYFCLAMMVDNGFYLAPESTFKAGYTLLVFDGDLPLSLLDKIAQAY